MCIIDVFFYYFLNNNRKTFGKNAKGKFYVNKQQTWFM